MILLWASLIVAGVAALAITAMLLVRRRALAGSYFEDGDRATPSPEVVGRIVTATVALVCVVIVYDGWATLKPFDIALVIVGPVVAICTTHIFSASLVQLARQPHG